MNKIKMLMLFRISIWYILATYAFGLETLCNSNYCLYSNFTSRQYYDMSDAHNECLQLNSNGWLLEIYDEDVSKLADNFISQHYLQINNRNILLNTKTSLGWIWMNKIPFRSGEIINLGVIYGIVAYLKKSTNNSLDYYIGDIWSRDNAWCQINSSFCTTDKNWIYNSSCSFIIPGSITWYEAETGCARAGGQLAVLDGWNLNDINKTWVQSWKHNSYWIGLTNRQYYWVKKDLIISFSKWNDLYPKTDKYMCTVINLLDSNSWINVWCQGNFSIICMTDNKVTSEISPLPSPCKFNQPSNACSEYTNPSFVPMIVGWVIAVVMTVVSVILSVILFITIRKLPSLENRVIPVNEHSQNASTMELESPYTTIDQTNVEGNRKYRSLYPQ